MKIIPNSYGHDRLATIKIAGSPDLQRKQLPHSKKIGMCSCPAQDQVIIIELINQNPVRADVGVPGLPVLS